MKECRRCEKLRPKRLFNKYKTVKDGLDSYCRECRNKMSRQYREKFVKKNSEKIKNRYEKYLKNKTDLEKKKTKTRQKANYLVKIGKIEKEICFICSKEKTEMHHIDYDYPEKIIWLCGKHHYKIHLIK